MIYRIERCEEDPTFRRLTPTVSGLPELEWWNDEYLCVEWTWGRHLLSTFWFRWGMGWALLLGPIKGHGVLRAAGGRRGLAWYWGRA